MTKKIFWLGGALLLLIVGLVAGVNTAYANNQFTHPVIGDILSSSDGAERVVVTLDGGLSAYSSTGEMLPGFPVYHSDLAFVYSPALANMDGMNKRGILVIAKSANSEYSAILYNNQGQILSEVAIVGNLIQEPVVAPVFLSVRDEVLVSLESGELIKLSYSDSVLNIETIINFSGTRLVSVNKDGNYLWAVSPDFGGVEVYHLNSGVWSFEQAVVNGFSFTFPITIETNSLAYGVTTDSKLLAFDPLLGSFENGFPVDILGQAVGGVVVADVDTSVLGSEIVVNLSNGDRAVFDLAGNRLNHKMTKKSFLNRFIDVNALFGGLYSMVGNYVGEVIDNTKKVVSSIYSQIRFSPVIESDKKILLASFNFDESEGSELFLDSSEYNNHASCGGDSCPTAGQTGISGNAVAFDGINDYLNLGNSQFIQITEAVTLETWIKPEPNQQTKTIYQVVAGRFINYELTISDNGALRTGIVNQDGTRVVFDTPAVINMYQWNHIAMTYDGNMIRAYANGVLVGERPQTGLIRDSGDFRIGSLSSGYNYKGLMDEVKIYTRALTGAEIVADFEVYQPESVVIDHLSFSFEETGTATTFLDNNASLPAVCKANECPTTEAEGVSGKALSFDGTRRDVVLGNNQYTKITDTITLEAWIKPEVNPNATAWQAIFGKTTAYELTINDNGILRGGITNTNKERVVIDAHGIVSFDVWNHVAMTYDGNMIKTYVNGIKVGEKAQTGQIVETNDNAVMGNLAERYSYFYKGLLDEVKIYTRALSDVEILASYTSNNPLIQYSGSLVLNKNTSTPDQVYVPGSLDVILGSLTVEAGNAEDIILSSLNLSVSSELDINNVSVWKGQSNLGNLVFNSSTSNIVFNNLVIEKDTPLVLDIRGNINNEVLGTGQVFTVLSAESTGLSSGSNIEPSGMPLELQSVTYVVPVPNGSINIYLDESVGIQIHEAGQDNVLLGSFIIETGDEEDVVLQSIDLDLSTPENVENISLWLGGSQVSIVIISPNASNTFTFDSLNLTGGSTTTIEIHGDVSASTTETMYYFTVESAIGVGVGSGETITFDSSLILQNNIVMAVVSNGSLDIALDSQFVSGTAFIGTQDNILGSFELSATFENIRLKGLTLSISASSYVGMVNIYDSNNALVGFGYASADSITLTNLSYVVGNGLTEVLTIKGEISPIVSPAEIRLSVSEIVSEGVSSLNVIQVENLPLELQLISVVESV